ncbi:branched-chain amino acid ABC transporter permease [Corynebacterium liangguodongii]|uniref:Branched-chain amino acid ABC transporter permease n=1 Tax=Corynebacterium liangguodongii TaxID=2079535 RepID=A0A2S0WHM5_9CORY|nr:branched-chain amino acid ABC transporter permease [Corynebacterium liangguodongii]PWB99417.1 branched-chain amino acid ABC transporter permease [Corynebacterium liangguodongii]
MRDSALVGLGVVPLGLAFGLLMTQSGFAWWWTPIFSTVIYAGSMEFLALSMVTAGVGPLSAAVTGFMVNFRHIFYGLTFPRGLIRSRAGRAYSTYALTDECYAIASATQPRSGVRVLTIEVFCQLLWVLPGIVGALAGRAIPPEIKGMEFALTALFVVLAYESFQASRDLSAVLLAAGIGALAGLVAPAQMLMVALTAYFVVLIVRFSLPAVDERLRWEV